MKQIRSTAFALGIALTLGLAPGLAQSTAPTKGGDAAASTMQPRTFSIRYRVPKTPQKHRVTIRVQDSRGIRTVFDKARDGGQDVKQDFAGTGRNIRIQLFDNGALIRDVTTR